jgi:hypothetical protein
VERLLGRVPEVSIPAVLSDYHRYKVRGEIYPAIVSSFGDQVEGLVWQDLTEDEIEQLDSFEGDEYSRIATRVKSKLSDEFLDCFVYVWNSDQDTLYDTWNFERDFLPKEQKFIHAYPYFIHNMGDDL